MDNEFKELSNNSYSKNPNKSTKHKKKIKTVVIILAILYLYGILLFVGAIPVPKWCVILNFRLNKNHFERLVDVDFHYIYVNVFDDGIEPYISETDDKELKKSMRIIFNGIWRRMTYDDYQKIRFFYPFNFRDAKARGVLYYEGSEENLVTCYGELDYVYNCYSLGDGWYYYEAAYKLRG